MCPSAEMAGRKGHNMKLNRSRSASLQSQRLADGRYVYYPAQGEPIYITPGRDVSEEIIIMLSQMDHDEELAARYDERHRDYGVSNIQAKVADTNDSTDEDPIDTLPDPRGDILSILFPDEEPTSAMVEILAQVMTELTPQQVDFIYDRFGLQMTETDIAARDGVTKQAVFNRQKKLFSRIRKLFGERMPL